jgi:hypothetical protein
MEIDASGETFCELYNSSKRHPNVLQLKLDSSRGHQPLAFAREGFPREVMLPQLENLPMHRETGVIRSNYFLGLFISWWPTAVKPKNPPFLAYSESIFRQPHLCAWRRWGMTCKLQKIVDVDRSE